MTRTTTAARDGARSRSRRGQHAAKSTPNRVEQRVRTHRAENTETTDSFQLFLNQAAHYPLLTAEEEVELAQRIERGDLEAKERLINSNVRLVISNARRYQGLGMSMQDLVQEAMLGLIRAAEKFDWRRGYKFSTYATLWIGKRSSAASTTPAAPFAGARARRPAAADRESSRRQLTGKLDHEPSDEEVAAEAKLPLDEVGGTARPDPGHDQPGRARQRGRRRDARRPACRRGAADRGRDRRSPARADGRSGAVEAVRGRAARDRAALRHRRRAGGDAARGRARAGRHPAARPPARGAGAEAPRRRRLARRLARGGLSAGRPRGVRPAGTRLTDLGVRSSDILPPVAETPQLLDDLLRAPAPSGYEGPAGDVWRGRPPSPRSARRPRLLDRPGRRGAAPLLAVVGHIDEIGLVDHPHRREGLPLVRPDRRLGPADPGRPAGRGADGKDGPVPGVVGRKPIHLLKAEQRKKVVELSGMHIDIGAADERGGRGTGPGRRPGRDRRRAGAARRRAAGLPIDGQPPRRLRRAGGAAPLHERGGFEGQLRRRRRGAGGDRLYGAAHRGLRARARPGASPSTSPTRPTRPGSTRRSSAATRSARAR